MKYIYKKNSGFTLIETLVAISIFTVSIVLLMSVLGNGISDINNVKKKMIAGYLAQEGIECVRNTRDNYVLYPDATHDWSKFVVLSVNSITCPSVDSSFTRTITKIPVGESSDEVKISSTVSWTQGSGPQNVTFSENLFNWVEQ